MLARRAVYVAYTIPIVWAGLASRRHRSELPQFVGEYAGDTLWALMVYLLVSSIIPARSVRLRAMVAITIAFLVELSQCYHAPWLDAIRQTTWGGLILGFGFLWTDLLCYAFGVAIGAVIERGATSVLRIRSGSQLTHR